MPSAFDRIASGLLTAAIAVFPRAALAGGEVVDASYGRVDGDITLSGGAGCVLTSSGARVQGELRARYLETTGVFVTYEEAQAVGTTSGPQRVLAGGMELRPLFLFRWLQGHEVRVPRLDLAVDSIALELGAILAQPQGGDLVSHAGFEVGLGVEVPILPRVSGPWVGVRGALRWSEAAMGAGIARGAEDRELVVVLTVAWHQVVGIHLVDAGDRAPR
jgi:hypothetical protein